MSDEPTIKPCRACGERPRAPGKMRCRECLDAAGRAAVELREADGTVIGEEEIPELERGPMPLVKMLEPPITYDAGLPYPGGVITSKPDEMQRLLDRIDELEAENELLRNPLSAAERWRVEKADILDKLAERAKAGDVQAIKAWSELRKLEAMEAETTGQTSIDDLVVPAGTRVDSTPTKEKP